ncbi:3-dehydroquinate synthase [Stereum hirsutum FP-91666 SS1]|uniref:3-dehydroquinate synthase n=1 Tax=Stereum hirsutum (strain FP-91666) TaxID=721885 RepID=UPI000440D306|nr:3-dehydroquinate synthase [Stereum hirsutum FP-91666 SS1]EIM87903.1 3-dehydroquinate synthase [Stereum hirsutum FP-91666 SS1]
MSELTACLTTSENGFLVTGNEELRYEFQFIDDIFHPKHEHLAMIYRQWNRVLLVTDSNVDRLYSKQWTAYFAYHNILLDTFVMEGGEKNKTMTTMLSIVDAMNAFGVNRKEPVLIVGGGVCTDVAGYACASYRRGTNFIRVPTTLIGLIDASVSIKVGVNHGVLKNRLGDFHAPLSTFLDFDMLKTLPEAHVRDGLSELMKITSCTDVYSWKLLVDHGPALIDSRFGRTANCDPKLKKIADDITYRAIKVMLALETSNLHEIRLDRVMAYGHSLSPTLELTPIVPLRHGHAVNIDMAYFITFAWTRGYLTEGERDEHHYLSHSIGLSMDHELFTCEMMWKAIEDIKPVLAHDFKNSRNGKQRFVMPKPYGSCIFVNDVAYEELYDVLEVHKALVKEKYGSGDGIEAVVDDSSLGINSSLSAK